MTLYGDPECIPNYRLRKNDLESFLSRIFPSWGVRAKVCPFSVLPQISFVIIVITPHRWLL
jgi:hypothetical protein